MIGFQVFRNTQTTLDLNGPILSFVSQPTNSSTNSGGSIVLNANATASFPQSSRNTNTGSISYQWYEVGVGALSNSSTISGINSTTLTLSNLINPSDNSRRFYLQASYNPSAYNTSSLTEPGTARSTGRSVNEPVNSNIAIITVNPTITINTQPSNSTVSQNRSATFTVNASASDNSALSYQWYVNGIVATNNNRVSGANTDTLTISSETISENEVYVIITHPSSGDSPLQSDTAIWSVVTARSIINYELVDDSGTWYENGFRDLSTSSLSFTADSSNTTKTISIYSPERNVRVRATMAAAAGASNGSNRGGQGGIGVFEFTLNQNQEYIIKLGSQTTPSGGRNGGAGGSYLYKKGVLLVALGGGGGAGSNSRGGDGGGIGVSGENGQGRNGGTGGQSINSGDLPSTGFFAGGQVFGSIDFNSTTGGRVSGCTPGDYWRSQNISACSDIGQTKFRGSTGTIANQTATILRGYKAGFIHVNNGGNATGSQGGGGSGATGGSASSSGGDGGGGGSGYTNGEVIVVTSQLGGNLDSTGYITLELI